ncbi:MAG: hypothetical protein B1H04_01105 [Planctomycetales bacterium 4484_123]|nr:MAG: hypothetical protein B1H04_01105 [Planctomycetales bacterium 4484_123]
MPVEANKGSMSAVQPQQMLSALDDDSVQYRDEAARRRVAALVRSGCRWSVVKGNVARTVYRGDGGPGAGVFYLKHFHSPALLHRLRRRLGWSDAGREMRFSEYLSRHRVPVPRVLAACCRGGVAWLITEGIEPAVPADRWHMEALARGDHVAIRRATVALAELVGRMHASGVLHRDLHCGNVLVRPGAPGQVVLTDLHRVRRRRRLSRRSRAANLAQLLHDRRLWTTRSQRLRFLRHYLRASGAEGTLRGWVRLIEPLARRHSRRVYAQRDRRIFGRNRYFAPLAAGGYCGQVVLASKRQVPGSRASAVTFRPEDWRDALADPEGLFRGPEVQVVKDSPSSLVVRRRLRVGSVELDVFIKRARRKKAIRWVLDLFRPSRSMRAFGYGHALLARHIYNALPLAAMERRWAGFLLDSFLITEAVDGAMHLNRFLSRYLGRAEAGEVLPAAQQRHLAREVLWQLGRLVRRLHEEGFAHRDLKASNLLVRWSGQVNRPPQIIMVDLDGLRRVRRVTARQQFRGLMRLNVSLLECPAVNHAGRLRMLLGYLRRPGAGRVNFKPYWRELQRWSGEKIRRQIRSRQRRQRALRRKQP